MKPEERLCYLTFDDVHIEPSLSQFEKEDFIVGFHNITGLPRPTFASKATVFMARGICSKWKQPLAFFNESSMEGPQIAVTIKTIYRKLRSIGLTMLATVSDQGGTNTTAIEYLV